MQKIDFGERKMYTELFNLIGMMILLAGTGYVLSVIGLITKEGKKCITSLVVNVVLPCNIIAAFSQQLPAGIWSSLAVVLAVAVTAQVLSTLAARVCYNKLPDKERTVLRYATVCSNAGFMGNPLALGVFGDIGLLYASVYLIPQRIVMWSAGISYFSGEKDHKAMVKKVITHPCIIAVGVGLVLMILQIRLPGALGDTVDALSSCCTALSFLVIGSILAEIPLKTIFNGKLLLFSAQRLLILPALLHIICLLAGVDNGITGVCVLLTAMPAGTTTSLLAAMYHGDEIFATKCIVLTTLLSLLTTPLWCWILL